MKIVDLRTEHKMKPLCIDTKEPVFGWNLLYDEKECSSSIEEGHFTDVYQEAYRIWVWKDCHQGKTDECLVWDSGLITDNQMTEIPYKGKPLESSAKYTWEVECKIRFTDEMVKRKVVKSERTWFETGYFYDEDWKGCFIGETKDKEYHLYRKAFECSWKEGISREVVKAKLYVCGLGHFEGYLNGMPISDHVLEPGWSDYEKTCFYTAYDVTEGICNGQNELVFKLGDGMFNVPGGRYVYYERSYGKMKLLVQLELTFFDGHQEMVVTGEDWEMTKSPILFCCIYGGEDYDGRLWKGNPSIGYEYPQNARWEAAVRVEPPKGILKAMPMEPVKVMETYKPVSISQTKLGVWLFDLGTNFSGWVRIRLRTNGKMAGQKVVMTPGELPDGIGKPNERGKIHRYSWTYILNEKEEQEFAPDFTYTGLRYVELTGAVPEDEASMECRLMDMPVLISMIGEFIYTAVEKAGEFSCSNSLFNSIHQIVLQAIKSNMKSYLTDCPQREKLPWLEQSHLIGPSIMYNFDVCSLYSKIEGDMADAQHKNGLVPSISPEYVTGFEKYHKGFMDSPEWGSACIVNPWYVYKRYGDIYLLKKYYPVMKRYLNYLEQKTHHEVLHHGLGDWLDIGPCMPNSQNTPVPVVATCMYYYDLDIMCQITKLLGFNEDEKKYRERMEKVYQEYNKQFLDNQTGRYANGSQAAQAMSLIAGLVPEEFDGIKGLHAKVIGQLRQDIEKRGYAITAGDIGHPFLIAAMKKYGMSDLLCEMTNITETPGYGYQVVNGATTLTEAWDGPNPTNPHGSQNHLMLGSIEEWFYGSLGGIELVRKDLPLGEVRIVPQMVEGIDFVDTWVRHPYGRILVSWERKETGHKVSVTIPPNVTAYLELKDGSVKKLGSGKHIHTHT